MNHLFVCGVNCQSEVFRIESKDFWINLGVPVNPYERVVKAKCGVRILKGLELYYLRGVILNVLKTSYIGCRSYEGC